MIEDLTVETFEDRVGDGFRLVADDGTLDLSLVECERLREAAREREPFSLVFLGPSEPILPQQIYRLEHDELGELEIFLVPIAQDADGTRYEAVFT